MNNDIIDFINNKENKNIDDLKNIIVNTQEKDIFFVLKVLINDNDNDTFIKLLIPLIKNTVNQYKILELLSNNHHIIFNNYFDSILNNFDKNIFPTIIKQCCKDNNIKLLKKIIHLSNDYSNREGFFISIKNGNDEIFSLLLPTIITKTHLREIIDAIQNSNNQNLNIIKSVYENLNNEDIYKISYKSIKHSNKLNNYNIDILNYLKNDLNNLNFNTSLCEQAIQINKNDILELLIDKANITKINSYMEYLIKTNEHVDQQIKETVKKHLFKSKLNIILNDEINNAKDTNKRKF